MASRVYRYRNRVHVFASLLILLLGGCSGGPAGSSADLPNNVGAAGSPPNIEFDCDIVPLFLADVSGSMNEPASTASGATRLQIFQDHLSSMVSVTIPDTWTTGLVTFAKDSTVLTWGMELLNDSNRGAFIDTIWGLTTGTSSKIIPALAYSGLVLADFRDFPRFLVVFTDGDICRYNTDVRVFDDCEDVENLATELKNDNVTIITAGFQLENGSVARTALENIASDSPTAPGTSLYFDLTNSSDVERFFSDELELLCAADVEVQGTPNGFRMAPGGRSSFDYMVEWKEESDEPSITGELNVDADFGFVATDQYGSPAPLQVTVSDVSPRFSGKKGTIRLGNNISPGEHEVGLTFTRIGADTPLASDRLTIEVAEFRLATSFVGTPEWRLDEQKIHATVAFEAETAVDESLTLLWGLKASNSTELTVPGFSPAYGGQLEITFFGGFADIREQRIVIERLQDELGNNLGSAGTYEVWIMLRGNSLDLQDTGQPTEISDSVVVN